MKKTHNKLTCLFGHHDYSEELTRDKDGHKVYLCKICKRSGYGKWGGAYEAWFDYDEEGNCTHRKWGDGDEYWYCYDKQGNWIYEKRCCGGREAWVDNNGNWVEKKPENWKYEKNLQ